MGEVVRVDRWQETSSPWDTGPKPEAAGGSAPEGRQRWVDQEIVRLLYRHPVRFYLVSFVAAVVSVAVLWSVVPHPLALLWLGLAALLTIGQIALVRAYRRQKVIASIEEWGRRYLVGVTVCGVMWGAMPILLFPSSMPYQSFVLVVLGGVTAAAMAVLSTSRWGFTLFVLPAILPLIARVAIEGDPIHVGMAGLIGIFLLTLAGVSHQLRLSLVDGLSLRYENEELISELSQVNEGLISQIEARKLIDRELEKRDAILEAVSFAGERLLNHKSSIDDPRPILARLGQAALAKRAALITLSEASGADGESDEVRIEHYYEWRQESSDTLPRQPPFSPAANPRWAERLRRGRAISGSIAEFPASDRQWLERFGVCSLAVLPVFADHQWWGVLLLEDEHDRLWSKAELEALTTAADILGAAVHRNNTEAALAKSDSQYQMLAENTNDLVALHDLTGRYLYVSPSCEELLGYQPEELLGKELGFLCTREELERVQLEALAPASRGETTVIRWQMQQKDGGARWFEMTTQPVEDPNGQVSMLVSSSRDVTGHKETEDELFQEKELAQVTLQSIGDGVVTTAANGIVRFLNPVAEELTGWTHIAARGKPIERVLNSARSEDQARVAELVQRCQRSDRRVQGDRAIRLLDRNADELAVEVSGAPIHDQVGKTLGTVIVLRDVTRTNKLAAQLTYQATHDALTGLLNRREFVTPLSDLVSHVHSRVSLGAAPGHHAFCYLDLDQFKVVNDTCGHIAGDELLRQISKLIRGHIRHSDTVARLGGDEFGILLRDCPIDKAEAMAETLCRSLRDHRFSWQDQLFRIGASIGVVQIDENTSSDAQVLSLADAACFAAKDRGRGRVHRFTPDDQHLATNTGEMQWISAIHNALDSDRFRLRYQPIVPPSQAQPHPERMEILLTMIGPDGEEIAPDRFIPAAERFNVMGRLDRWVVSKTFELLATHWRSESSPLRECFINLSGSSIADDSFLDFLKRQLRVHKIPHGTVCFEITETAAIANLGSAADFMEELRELGCRFALDDFGSGLSSFGYLRSLPVDFIKIDGSFVREIAFDPVNYAIVESIHTVGRHLRIKTIAEFVETPAALAKLMLLGVDFVQGYAIAPPASLDSMLAKLDSAN